MVAFFTGTVSQKKGKYKILLKFALQYLSQKAVTIYEKNCFSNIRNNYSLFPVGIACTNSEGNSYSIWPWEFTSHKYFWKQRSFLKINHYGLFVP